MDGAGREGPWAGVEAENEKIRGKLSQCPQRGLDPGNGTELRTLETKLAGQDEEGGGPTVGPGFRAAEQSSRAQFQIFPVSLGEWVRCRGKDSCQEPHTVTLSLLPSFYPAWNAFPQASAVNKYLLTDTVLM